MQHLNGKTSLPTNDGVDVPANGPVIDALRTTDGYRQEGLAKLAGISRSTIARMENGATVKREALASIAFIFRVPVEVLILAAPVDCTALPRDREWNPARGLLFEKVRRLPNGLLVRVGRLESTTHRGVFGRLKIYDLEDFQWNKLDAAAEMLRRHAEVCRRIRSPHVVQTYICEPDQSGRYCVVVDEWLDGMVLEDASAPLTAPAISRVAYDLLVALKVLHSHQIICRGLSPATVQLQASGAAVIVGLELAKLLEHTRTIRPKDGFERDRFLSPEVYEQARQIGPPADLYSWALIVAWLAGERSLPAHEISSAYLHSLGLPQKIAAACAACLSQIATKRPQSVDALLPLIAEWASTNEAESE